MNNVTAATSAATQSNTNIDDAREALNELDELRAAMSAVADLSEPGDDLHCVNRNNLATLLGLLLRLQGEATKRAWDGLQAIRDRENEGAKLADLAALIVARDTRGGTA